jgi:hypothetical protein
MYDHRAIENGRAGRYSLAVGAMAGGAAMVAATVEGVIWGTLAVLVMAVLCFLAGVYGLAELRIWWARRTGRGSCQFRDRDLTIRVVGLLRLPEGFFSVCSWCGRDQPEVS